MIKEFLNYSVGFALVALVWMGVAYVGIKLFAAYRRELRSRQ